jgi:hypothetical protein
VPAAPDTGRAARPARACDQGPSPRTPP